MKKSILLVIAAILPLSALADVGPCYFGSHACSATSGTPIIIGVNPNTPGNLGLALSAPSWKGNFKAGTVYQCKISNLSTPGAATAKDGWDLVWEPSQKIQNGSLSITAENGSIGTAFTASYKGWSMVPKTWTFTIVCSDTDK